MSNSAFYSTDLGMADHSGAIENVFIRPGPILRITIVDTVVMRALYLPAPLYTLFCRPTRKIIEDTKRCKQCNEVKPRASFSKRTASKDGLKHRCKSCISVRGD